MGTTTKYNKKTHLIVTNRKGIITFTDNNLFCDLELGQEIYNFNSFFEIINSLLEIEGGENEFSFPCVHLTCKNLEDKICDINITIDLKEITIVIFDYTETYNKLNKVSQQRNESIIKTQKLEFENKLLQIKESFKNEFITNINHEIVTPITSIKGFLELLQKTKLDYEQTELVKIIKTESDYLERIFSDMLDLSKIESGTFNFVKEPFNFVELINSIQDSFKLVANKNAINFEVFIDSKINPNMIGDKTRIYQVISNLLNNAFKYTEEGYVKLSVAKKGGKYKKQIIEIKVEDSGIGIENENLKSIFDAFIQYNDKGEGSGLGLHVVRNLVKLMGGDISVESQLGKGTQFALNIRLSNNINIEEEEKEEKKGSIKIKPPKTGRFRALIVENKKNLQYLITSILIDQKSFFVDVVSSAEEAQLAIENRKYDILILDVKLPKMNGFEFASKVRKEYSDTYINEIPILGISALKTQNIENKCILSGMDSYMPKPFSEELFIKKIKKLLKRKRKLK